MARIPVLNVPGQLPNVTPSVTATPAQFGGVEAAQLGALGTAVGEAAGAVKYVQEQEDAVVVLNAEAQLKEATTKRQAEYQKRRGINALGLTKQADADWNEAYKTFENGLTSPRQKALLNQRALGVRTAHIESVSLYEAQQGKAANEDATIASIKSSNDFAAANALNPAAVEQSRKDITRLSQYLSASRGDSPEATAFNAKAVLTVMHLGVLRNLADAEPAAARAYFAQNKEEIDGTQHDEINKLLKTASRRALAQSAGDEAIQKFGDARAALTWARGKYNKDGEDRHAVELEIKSRFAENIELRKQSESEAFDKAYKLIEKGTRYSALPPSLLNGLSGQGRAALGKAADEHGQPDTASSAGSQARYDELIKIYRTDPDTFAKMDFRQESALRRTERDRLMELRSGAATKTPAYLKSVGVEKQLSATYNALGIHDDDKDEKTLERKGALQNEVYRRVAAEQATLKRDLTDREVEKLIDETVIKGTVDGSRWYWFDKTAFAFQLTPEELKTFTPDKLPPTLRAQIVTAIQRSRGTADPVTEQDIVEAYRKLTERERTRLGISGANK